MLVVYASRTTNIQRFMDKLTIEKKFHLTPINAHIGIKEKYILITYTDAFGEIPFEVDELLKDEVSKKNCMGLIGSGNRNWGQNFAIAADKSAKIANTKVIYKFELSGNRHDVDFVQNYIDNH